MSPIPDTGCEHRDMAKLILASASPRRKELLTQAGFSYQVHPAHIPEDPYPGEDPLSYVLRLAREKAEAAYSQLLAAAPQPEPFHILGADTTVTIDGQILAKPDDRADAARMLALLSGRTHQVITGVALLTHTPSAPPVVNVAAETTSVQFLPISPEEIAAYVGTGEPMDKAGAYAIQGRAARWIPRIEGCYFNVVGLPLSLVSRMIHSAR